MPPCLGVFEDFADGVLLIVFEKTERIAFSRGKRFVVARPPIRRASLLHILHPEIALERLDRPAIDNELADTVPKMLPAIRWKNDLRAR